MIKLLAFNKTYNKKKIISFDKLEFEDNGLYLIYGRSGCGKTTLLNCLSLLETFEGEYYFDGKQIKLCTEDEKTQIRKEKITYIHQKPVLLNEFSVFDNIKLFSTFKEGEILNYLSLFGLRDKKDVLVKFISGGEKQRLSIIKALILNKPIIFADEPTGSLDIENSKFVIKKLKELSKNQLVIVVSHDVNLFKSISDCIIEVKNKKIEIKKQKTIKDIKKKTHINNSDINKKELRKKFKKNIIKKKKIKNVLITIFTTLSLVCVSFTMLLSFNVKNSLIDGFSEFYEPNQLVIQNRTNNIITQKRNSPSNDEINKLEEILNSKSRIFYSTNFENFFKDANSLHLLLNYKTVKIEGYSARQFNEFKSIHVADTKYLLKNNLDDEEIVISIDNQMMLEFCFQLSITKSFQSLFNYIKNHDVLLSLFIKNFDWQYEDEQLFKLVGFVVEPERFIYHSNNLFSYLLFEEKMRLPSTIFDEIQDKPWYLKKEYIFEIDSEIKDLFYYDKYLSNFYIEKINYNDFQTWYDRYEIDSISIYKIYKKSNQDLLPPSKIERVSEKNYEFYLSNNSYIKNSLVSGFVNEIFLAPDHKTIDYIEDNYFTSEVSGKIKVDDKLNVVGGGMLVDIKHTLSLKIDDELKENKLYISSKLYEQFEKSLQNSNIFLVSLVERVSVNNKIRKDYVKTQLTFDGIIKDDSLSIFGNKYILNSFFRDVLGYKYEKYATSAVNINVNNEIQERQIRSYFYNFNVTKPFEEINNQINQILSNLTLILSIFSIIVVCISIFLLMLIVKSLISDFKEDFYVLYCNGISRKEIGKILKKYVLDLFIKSTFTTILFNLLMSLMISFVVSNSINSTFNFSFSYESILASVCLSVFMVVFGYIFVNKFLKNENVVISIRN